MTPENIRFMIAKDFGNEGGFNPHFARPEVGSGEVRLLSDRIDALQAKLAQIESEGSKQK